MAATLARNEKIMMISIRKKRGSTTMQKHLEPKAGVSAGIKNLVKVGVTEPNHSRGVDDHQFDSKSFKKKGAMIRPDLIRCWHPCQG